MTEAERKLKIALDIFQALPQKEQLQIKEQEPDLYHALFGGDIIPNTYYLEPFIEKYQEGEQVGATAEQAAGKAVNLSGENGGFKSAKFSKVPAGVAEGQNIFQQLSIETQKMIKEEKPNIYNMLFKENVFVDTAALSAFTKDYPKESLEIKTMSDLNKLPLTAQLDFKKNFPGEYGRIVGIIKD
ncbi:hypothetical protein [Chryseobacterium profundimaris]|uniref:Uncharacterized protein n=1 Tax=Chryseobacterium profundimaris TaxID=1387275 RepID=A0ABY1NG78_9FLAO|nr:hypothetical protein [Chryseobacterium profundimaris]SMP08940.1 hypothetical protein SAMN06264346_10211 [Chryseobacterium profundimaris]